MRRTVTARKNEGFGTNTRGFIVPALFGTGFWSRSGLDIKSFNAVNELARNPFGSCEIAS
ncbi:MAG TPA: hypothetical protein DDZ40_09705 [Deltaproteobacteria bacterium]|nr:hypothetical protein [Deltaproteobacteria bacterium]